MLKVGIIGVGTVGASVANILRDNKNIITACPTPARKPSCSAAP